VAITGDGKTLASGSYDTTIKLWNLATGKEISDLPGHSGIIHSVAFSPDGKTLASGSQDDTVKLWHVATGREIRTLKHGYHVRAVVFTPDGKTLATGGEGPVLLGPRDSEFSHFLLQGRTLHPQAGRGPLRAGYCPP
jgi:WD40 repeat protein